MGLSVSGWLPGWHEAGNRDHIRAHQGCKWQSLCCCPRLPVQVRPADVALYPHSTVCVTSDVTYISVLLFCGAAVIKVAAWARLLLLVALTEGRLMAASHKQEDQEPWNEVGVVSHQVKCCYAQTHCGDAMRYLSCDHVYFSFLPQHTSTVESTTALVMSQQTYHV